MSPSNAHVVSQLRHLIHYNLDNDLLQNALFLAGRLHGLDPRSADTVYLVALCHLKLGHFRAAYDYAKDTRLRTSTSTSAASASALLGCAYVFAQACLALRRYSEGISALERCRGAWQAKNHWNKHSETERRPSPDAPAVCNVLGKLCRANGEEKKAAEYFAESLKGNPFMWDAFVDLSDSGVPMRTANVFKLTDDMRKDLTVTTGSEIPAEAPQQTVLQALATKSTNEPNTPATYDPFNPTRSAVDPGLNHGGPNFMSRLNGNTVPGLPPSHAPDWDTPLTNSNRVHYDEDVVMDDNNVVVEGEAPPAPLRKKGGLMSFVSDTIDAPKMRSMTTRGRYRLDPPSEELRTGSGIPISHKRTVSGAPPPGSSSQYSNTSASDASAQGIRRSTRIQNHTMTSTTTTTTTKSSASSRLAGVFKPDTREKRDLPKAKATGIKGRAGVSTVGRVVSGNRKALGPGERDLDSKEGSRPASVASTIRESREPVTKRPGMHANVIIEQSSHDEEALRWLLDIFGKLGEGYYYLTRYNPQRALDIFKTLPTSQRETPWVLTKIGRALYEKSQYKEAAEVFARVRKHGVSNSRDSGAFGGSSAESAWMEDMHIYSTVLWHLKREIELAYLSHELLELDRLAPEAWVTLGNSFSLQREHEKAIKCFKRATQLSNSSSVSGTMGDKGGAYAWTLMGHEHVVQEEFDKAQECYRAAISSNPRHYAGWYGLGQVYEKLGKYDTAERHYRVAWGVNPKNGVLAVCLGLVSEKLARENGSHGSSWVLDPRGESKVKEALKWYDTAVRMDSKSAKARFMKARTLMRLAQMPNGGGRLDQYESARDYDDGRDPRKTRLLQARAELEVLREMAGDESMVHFLLGRCLKLLGDRPGAIREMTIALELDPKASPHIKEALESLEVDEDGSYDEDDDD